MLHVFCLFELSELCESVILMSHLPHMSHSTVVELKTYVLQTNTKNKPAGRNRNKLIFVLPQFMCVDKIYFSLLFVQTFYGVIYREHFNFMSTSTPYTEVARLTLSSERNTSHMSMDPSLSVLVLVHTLKMVCPCLKSS